MGKRKKKTSSRTPPRAEHRTVKARGIAVGGDASGAAIGDNARIVQRTTINCGSVTPVKWPIRVGAVPPLASPFQHRPGLRALIEAARSEGEDVVLAQRDESGRVLVGEGGVGKSQLAASYYLDSKTDLAVWTTARGGMSQLVADFANAAFRIAAPGATGEDDEADARALLEWLRATQRSWLVVIDDIDDLDVVLPWWPHASHHGWVLATTRQRKALGAGRHRVDVDVFTPAESYAFLHDRAPGLPAHPGTCTEHDCPAERICHLLGHLPLALSHAAAFLLNNRDVTPTAYARLLEEPGKPLADVLPADGADGYGRAVHTTLLINLDAVEAAEPRPGLARSILSVLALLDPNGSPASLWTHPAALTALTGPGPSIWQLIRHPKATLNLGSREADTAQRRELILSILRDPTAAYLPPPVLLGLRGARAAPVRESLLSLDRYSLITYLPPEEPANEGLVRIHALTARAARDAIADINLPALARRTADALVALWPEQDYQDPVRPHLQAAAALLLAYAPVHLITRSSGVHALFRRASLSQLQSPSRTFAINFDRQLAATAAQLLGPRHRASLVTRANLAVAYRQAGRTDEAAALLEQVLADAEEIFGPRHLETLVIRTNLAVAYRQAGRTDEAIALLEQVLADAEEIFGPRHRHTQTTRGHLANSYQQGDRTDEAITLLKQVLAAEEILGPLHTLVTRGNLAVAYQQAGRTDEAIALLEQVLADAEEILGPRHPDTLVTRGNLAVAYQQAGRTDEAIALLEQVLADAEEILGPRHRHTQTTRSHLADSYQQAGRTV